MKVCYQLPVLAAMISFASVSSLTCHTCYSEKSWFDCLESIKTMKCPGAFDSCATIQLAKKAKSGKEFFQFVKMCYEKKTCTVEQCTRTTNSASDTWTGIDCDISCCDTDFCNANSRPSPSSHIWMTCVTLVVLFVTN